MGVIGGALLLAAAALPWLGDFFSSHSAIDVPLALAWDGDAEPSSPSVGLVVALLGLIVLAISVVDRAWLLRQLAAGTALVVIVAVAVQVAVYAHRAGADWAALLNSLTIGVYVAFSGAVVALVAPVPSRDRADGTVASAPGGDPDRE